MSDTTKTNDNVDNTTLCSINLFRYFFRKCFNDTEATNEELDELNILFSKYLRDKCSETQLANFLPKNEMDVFLNQNHPLKTNGFEPAFILNFHQFIEIEAKKQLDRIS